MLIIQKMLVFLILMLVGLLLAKVKIIDELTTRKLSAIVLFVAGPALIINSSQTDHSIQGTELLTTLLVAIVLFGVLVAAAAILSKIMKLNQTQASAYAMMTVFANIGYMGIPLVSELFGSAALLYVSVYILLFNILIYTYGVAVVQQGDLLAFQNRFSFRKFINPGVISCIIAVALYLMRIKLPEIITAPLEYLSNLNSPIGMLIIGAAFANVKIRSFFTDYKLLVFSVVRLLVLPILLCLPLKWIIGGGELLNVSIVMMCTPVASMTVMMARQYGGDYTLLSKGVALTSLLCIGTIPVVFAVLL